MQSDKLPEEVIGAHVELRYVPRGHGVGKMVWYAYGPGLWLHEETTGDIILHPTQAIELAEWILAHKANIIALAWDAEHPLRLKAESEARGDE